MPSCISVGLKFSQARNFSQTKLAIRPHETKLSAVMDARNPKGINAGRNYVREWRKFRKLTQEKLAEEAGYATSTISQLETGAQGYEESTLVNLAKVLECRPGDLISGPPAEVALFRDIRELPQDERDEVVGALNDILTRLKRIRKIE